MNIRNLQDKFGIQKMRFIFTITLILATTFNLVGLSLAVFAGETNKLAHEEFLHSENIFKDFNKQKAEFTKYKQAANKSSEKHKDIIDDIKKQSFMITNKVTGKSQQTHKAPMAIVFVSFSMPDLSLKQIITDAARYHIPVVIRGLIDNSFKKTVARIFELIKENNKGGVSINPIWFKRYSINTVPACVVKSGDNFDVIYGNIKIKNMLEIIASNGTVGYVAQSILDEGKI